MISGLRLLGIGVALLLLLTVAKNPRIRRGDFALWRLIALALLLVSAVPQVISIPAFLLSLDSARHTRIITVLLLAVVVLGIGLMGQRARTARLADQMNGLVDDLAVEEFRRAYGEECLEPVTVIIPAFQEADNIGRVLESIPREVHGQRVSVLVVVDGSRDGTREAAARGGAFVCLARVNRGGGAALRLGYRIAVGSGARFLVTLDADGQHLPSEMEGLLQPLLEDEADFAQGSRRLGTYQKDDAVRMTGIFVYGWLISLLTGQKITDSSNGFRAMKTEMVSALCLREDQYYSSELLIGAIRKGYRVVERPVTVERRHSGSSKKGKNLLYGFRYLKVIVRSWLRAM